MPFHYDKIELLKSKRSTNGYRTYDELDIHILRNIVVFKQAGFSLDDIRALTNLYSFEEGDECNDLAKEVVSKNLKAMHLQMLFLKKVTTTLEELSPLFQTHELYKINQKELDTTVIDLFEEVRKNKLEENTSYEK